MKTEVVDRVRVAIERHISRSELEYWQDHRLDICIDRFAGDLVARLDAYVLAQNVGEHVEVVRVRKSRPMTWWDHFKEEHPRLCGRLSPPRYVHEYEEREVRVKVRALFPHYSPPPSLGRYYRVAVPSW